MATVKSSSQRGADSQPLLIIEKLSKRFGRIAALQNVSLTMEAGRIYGLAGENGAGKSTLVKILSGVHRPDEGTLWFNGFPFAPASPAEAEGAGMSVFHQEIPICPNLSMAANVFLGPDLPLRGLTPDWRQMEQACERYFREWLGLEIDSRRLLRDCTVAERQLALLVRVLRKRAGLIILDEPTTALTPAEVSNLFVIVQRLKSQGVGLVLISHLLDELMEISDEIYVMRDGALVGHLPRPPFNAEELAGLIAGRTLTNARAVASVKAEPARLEVRALARAQEFTGISFRVAKGEIVAIAGAQGSGRSELSRALFAAPPAYRGEIILNGQTLSLREPRDAMHAGIGYVPEDRKTLGLFQNLNIQTNLGLLKLRASSRFGLLISAQLRTLTLAMQRRLQIKMAGPDAPVTSLSGGNQQKVLIGRWLTLRPQVLVLNEPTRGVDVGAKDEIWRLLRELAAEGTSFVIASSDLTELLQLADRILVLTQGRLTSEFAAADTSKAELVRAVGQRGLRPEP